MKYGIIYSRVFLEKVFGWLQGRRTQAFQAAEHAALNPNLHDYVRPNIVPYKQKLGLSDGQMKLYFLIQSTDIFVAWINDESCPHNTWNERSDPCNKEWQKLRANNEIETFDQDYHVLSFKVRPEPARPFSSKSRYFDFETSASAMIDPEGKSKYIAHSFQSQEEYPGIDLVHVGEFLSLLHDHLRVNEIEFEFHLIKMAFQREIDLLTNSRNPLQWEIIEDNEDFILRRI